MSQNLRISYRFLTAKKRSMLMSLSCIIMGVGLFVITQATTSGFQDFFITTIIGTKGALQVADKRQSTIESIEAGSADSPFEVQVQARKYTEGIDYPKQLEESLSTFPNVIGVSEVLKGSNVTIRSPFMDSAVQVYGINVAEHMKVSDLGHQIVEGSLDTFRDAPNGALLGRLLADRLHLEVNDTFQLETNKQARQYRVSAIFQTGAEDIDKGWIYLTMEQARSLLRKPTGASYLQVSLADRDRAEDDSQWMEDVLDHQVVSWQHREKVWLGVFRALGESTAITVVVFGIIAALAMFNTLAMIVLEKTKDIAILRSMGYTRQDISNIFLWQAVIVLAIGSAGGCLLGLVGTYGVSRVPMPVDTIFKTDTFLVVYNPWHYIEAVVISIIFVMFASLIPSRRAARLEPGDIIRGTAQ